MIVAHDGTLIRYRVQTFARQGVCRVTVNQLATLRQEMAGKGKR